MNGGLIWWGLALIIVGLILGAIGFGAGGMVSWIGWILLAVGVILAIVSLAAGRRHVHH